MPAPSAYPDPLPHGLRAAKALSLPHPWPWLLVTGVTRWLPKPRATRYLGPVALHCAATACPRLPELLRVLEANGIQPPLKSPYPVGHLVAVGALRDCTMAELTRPGKGWLEELPGWQPGAWIWEFAGWRALTPVRHPGRPGVFPVNLGRRSVGR